MTPAAGHAAEPHIDASPGQGNLFDLDDFTFTR